MDLVIVGVALLVSIGVAVTLLSRQRAHARPEDGEQSQPKVKARPTRQQRILDKLEPLPEIPTVMDLVREEIAETGVKDIPGHEGLAGPVMLKVYRRDLRVVEHCTHEGYQFIVAEGVEATEATEDDVILYCSECGLLAEEIGTDSEEDGTDSEE